MMDSDNSSDQFLTIQTMNPLSANAVPSNIVPLSPPSTAVVTPMHLQELTVPNAVASPSPRGTLGN